MKQLLISCLLLSLVLSSAFSATVYEFENTDHESQPATVEASVISIDGQLLKMDMKPSSDRPPKNGMIFRGDRKEMIAVDNERKSYFVIDEEGMRGMGNQISQMQQQMQVQMQEMLKNLDPERRAAAEKMMQQRMGGGVQVAGQPPAKPPSKVTNTGETDNINGYPCVKHVVTRGAEKVRELCITAWANIEGGAEAAGAMKSMAKFAEGLMSAMQKNVPMDLSGNAFAEINQVDGFPVSTRSFDNGRLTDESTFKSARRQMLDPAAFEPPSGYKRQSMGPGR